MGTLKRCTARTLLQQFFLTVIMLTTAMICIFTIYQMKNEIIAIKDFDYLDNDVLLGEYLLESENCKIPNLSPFSKESLSVYQAIPFKKCHKLQPLTSIDGNKLMIHEEYKKSHLSWWQNGMRCCYQRITRSGFNDTADNKYKLSECINFISGHVLDENDEFILVSCSGYRKLRILSGIEREIYKNAHALIVSKDSVNRKFNSNTNNSSFNVLLVGIDSISRLNLIRTMPNTFRYLKENNWYDMRIFNKIGYNTFPNLMAILTGLNDSVIANRCSPKMVGGLEKCKYLWNDYSNAHYATAYAEDTMSLSTFNYYLTGFIEQPTDYYFRPFALAAEDHLKQSYEKAWLSKCLGYQHYGDFVYQYAIDYAKKYENESFFGLFWTNSFSHDDLSAPSEYDLRMKYYLQQLEQQEILNNTIVVFFSDHGMRFGEIRNFFTGWLEERMPYLFFWLPEQFKSEYPDLSANLKVNENRLVSPFDIHVTLKHILKLSGKLDDDINAESCGTCQSLFYEVPHNRKCDDAGIDGTWCTCTKFTETDHKSSIIKKAAQYTVKKLNVYMSHLTKCAKLILNNVSSAREFKHGNTIDYLISFDVLPSKGQMEATVRCSEGCEQSEIIGEISRVNRYGNQSWCIKDANLRKFCFCK